MFFGEDTDAIEGSIIESDSMRKQHENIIHSDTPSRLRVLRHHLEACLVRGCRYRMER